MRRTSSLLAVEGPDFMGMIEHQATMLVELVRSATDVLHGRESAHSLRLLDLEQRREELQRRHRAAVDSIVGQAAGLDEIHGTMDILDRAAAGLFQLAHGFQQMLSKPDEATSQMMAAIRRASESLQQAYQRLANGATIAESDVDAATGSVNVLRHYRQQGLREALDHSDRHAVVAPAGRNPVGCAFRLYDRYEKLDDIAQELASAGVVLRRWSRRLSVYPICSGTEIGSRRSLLRQQKIVN
ncbi:MAG: hypothetical protein V5B32_01505 [Candidatus Accumulibacter sp. UW26]